MSRTEYAGERKLYDYREVGGSWDYFCTICNRCVTSHAAARASHTRMHIRKGEARGVLQYYPVRVVFVVNEKPASPPISKEDTPNT